MNYKTIIALCGFGILFLIGLLLIVGSLLKWKPLVDSDERQWLFSTQYMDRKFFGLPYVIIHNIVIGLGLILISLAAVLKVLN
jgi:hypothetical protein